MPGHELPHQALAGHRQDVTLNQEPTEDQQHNLEKPKQSNFDFCEVCLRLFLPKRNETLNDGIFPGFQDPSEAAADG